MDFLRDDSGQDLTEYALLIAFVVIASAGLLLTTTDSIMGIWSASNALVITANAIAKNGVS